MPSTTTPKAPPTKPKKDRERKEKLPVVGERLKTVVRRLPPNLPEDVFWGSVEPWVNDETATWKAYYPGKSRKRLGKENIPSRAYIAFRNEEQLSLFSREYDGHLFRDKAGNESQAVVEFAPYQKVPSEKKKVDARNATIEKDEDYISFIESLKVNKPEPVSLETLIAARQPAPAPTTTPLLEALKAEKSASKDKEAILRNHAHYKDATILAPTPRKDEPKKKGAPPTQRAPEPTTPAGKKPSKKPIPAPPVPPSAQKPPPLPAAVAKLNVGSSNIRPKSPKPPRPPKAPQQKVVQGGAKPAAPGPSVTAIQGAATAESPIAPPPLSGSAPSVPAAGLARRTRPVIGLASRQFEAALSGAGVSAGERKSRREREREREKEKETQAADGAAGSGPVGTGTSVPPKTSPPSPRRERHAKQIREVAAPGAAAAVNVGSSGGPVNAGPAVKVPAILQRIDGPSAGAAGEQKEVGATAPVSDGALGGGGRGGRRGRGRGRGGNPGAPVRGG
ncbi:Regulator of nonsense transcripts UPF3 [Hypsizygus marmoreus]|uniref:Regulator of nonsense transcripts UPF3 n=1 Tax=Hypsizygus marmoreus TaxID=39966 RepID=A0A369J6V2_HYPMA|nr:Regulator of nonsense transcripts UPF3 [Hypsizygus marmoreus]